MSDVQAIIDAETDAANGWEFRARILRNGRESRHVVHLAWADHDYWSGGSVPPSRVVAALLRVAARRLTAGGTPARFDASVLRRLIRDVDALIKAEIDSTD